MARTPNVLRLGRAIALLGLASVSMAQTGIPEAPPCLEEAATFHQVNPWVMRAIIWHESRNDFLLVSRNRNQSVDIGGGGINSTHLDELKKYGIEPQHLLNGCVNTYVAAWHLGKQMRLLGNSWAAVAAYHSRNKADGIPYARKIRAVLLGWGVAVE